MAAHCGPALESRAACALAAVGCVAAHVRSRVGRHPLDPCGHPAREEHTLPARMQRTRRESRPVRGTAAHKMQRGSRAGGQGGGRAGKLTLVICRAYPNCPWTPTSGRATRSTPAGVTCQRVGPRHFCEGLNLPCTNSLLIEQQIYSFCARACGMYMHMGSPASPAASRQG